jgi:hypothetical protein
MNEEISYDCCYYCVEETACDICRTLYHPLETDYCVRKACANRKLEHSTYVKPKECENRSCIFYRLRVAAEKNTPTNRKLKFENGDCFQS